MPAQGSPARSCGSAPSARWSCRREMTRSSSWRRAPPRTPSTASSARPSRGWPTSPCACSRLEPPAPARPAARAAQLAARGVGLYARTMPRCAAVICHAGHGTVARSLASRGTGDRLPLRRRPGRERRPDPLGRSGCVPPPPLPDSTRHKARGAEAPGRSRATPGGRASCATGTRLNPGPVTAADEVEALAARGGRAVKAPRGGFEPPRTD